MIGLLGNVLLLAALLTLGWFLLVGGTGATLATLLGWSPVLGFLLSVVVPLPGLGWLLVWFVASRRGQGGASTDEYLFPEPSAGYGRFS